MRMIRLFSDYHGNNIAVVDGYGKIVEQTNYYPYGEPWREATEQPFLYAGNERLRLFGLNEYDFLARRYNPILASFTTWDPLAEKYPWLSPYAYCAGNPINYIDPNGERIVVWEDDEEWEYRHKDGDYWLYNVADGRAYSYSDAQSFASKVINALGKIQEGEVGNTLVTGLMDSEKTLTIKEQENKRNGSKFDFSNDVLTWNPNDLRSGPISSSTFDGTRPTFIGLGHEMGHAFDSFYNKTNFTMRTWYIDKNKESIPMAEIFAGDIENCLRYEHGLPIRFSYGLGNNGKPDMNGLYYFSSTKYGMMKTYLKYLTK